MAGLAEALDVDAGLAAFVGDDAVVVAGVVDGLPEALGPTAVTGCVHVEERLAVEAVELSEARQHGDAGQSASVADEPLLVEEKHDDRAGRQEAFPFPDGDAPADTQRPKLGCEVLHLPEPENRVEPVDHGECDGDGPEHEGSSALGGTEVVLHEVEELFV